MAAKKIYRTTRSTRMILGVFGGLGEYLDVDPNLLRLGWVVVTLFTGVILGVIAYILAALIIPKQPGKQARS